MGTAHVIRDEHRAFSLTWALSELTGTFMRGPRGKSPVLQVHGVLNNTRHDGEEERGAQLAAEGESGLRMAPRKSGTLSNAS